MAADAVCLIVPAITGGGAIVKAITKLDDVVDAARTVENLTDAARAADNLSDSSTLLKSADNLDIGALCFVAGTTVLTEYGGCPIEDVEVSDFVWAWDEETNDFALREVVDTYASQTDELVHIIVDDKEIITTPNHPFYITYYGWTRAEDIIEGDNLATVGGEFVTVDYVLHEKLTDEVTVYNLNVEGYHTYFVSALGVLVHNKCIDTPNAFNADQQAVISLAKENASGMSKESAEILVGWAEEYGISSHHTMTHPGRSGIWGYTDHIKIKNVHIPVVSTK